MSSKITQGNFVDTMNKLGGLDADFGDNGMSQGTRSLLAQAGVSGADLWRIAGKGGEAGRIDTVEEMKELFTLLDRKDHDGSARSIAASSVQGAAYQALVTEMLAARARDNASEARMAPRPAEAPRVPSQRARETFRQDMQAVKDATRGLEKHQDTADRVGTTLKQLSHFVGMGAELAEAGVAALHVGGTAASTVGFAVAGPIIGLIAVFDELGEANEAGKHYKENKARVSAFADGVAGALDPKYAQKPPADRDARGMWERGRAYVAGLDAEERRQLEDALVLGHNTAVGNPTDDARVGQFYRGETYRAGIMDVWGQGSWKPLGE